MGRDGNTRVGKGEKGNGGGKGKGKMGGVGQGMGWERERKRRKGREREERGYSPPNFNSWRRHWWPGWSKPPIILSPQFLILATPV